MLVTAKELTSKALKEGWAVGAFNAINLETAQAIFEAANETKSPFILQITSTTLKYMPQIKPLIAAIKEFGDIYAKLPFALHLDHGRSFERCVDFINYGFSSVMIDGTLDETGKKERSYEENVEVTRQVVDYIRQNNFDVSVEGELGKLGEADPENPEKNLTDPAYVIDFIHKTGVDMLAVAIGTKHGLYKGEPKIYHERLEHIHSLIPNVPLVMHGGTGVSDGDVKRAIQNGIAKINIDTEIRKAFQDTCMNLLEEKFHEFCYSDMIGEPRKYDLREWLADARFEAKLVIMAKMELFGSAGRA